MVVFFKSWAHSFPLREMENAWNHGAVPHVVWEPTFGEGREPVKLKDIAEGKYDDYIRTWAREAAKWGKPFFLRFAHEFNGNWYPWSIVNNDKDPELYVKAWRHVHKIFKEEGAKAIWVWTPNSSSIPSRSWNDPMKAYPGDDYVDWVGIDGYNFGGPWKSFREVYSEMYYYLLSHIKTKPFMIPEFASAKRGGNKAQWIKEMDKALREEFIAFKAIAWFDTFKERDWRVASSYESLKAFREVVSSDYYLTSRDGLLSVPQRYLNEVQKIQEVAQKHSPFKVGSSLEIRATYISSPDKILKEDIASEKFWSSPPEAYSVEGDDSLSYRFKAFWTDNGLVFVVDVKDDVPFKNSMKDGMIWNGDCVEFMLGLPEMGRLFLSDADYQIGIKISKKIQTWNWQTGAPLSKAVVDVKPTSKGYAFKVFIPWEDVPALKSYASKGAIGFVIAVDDDDSGSGRQRQVVLGGDSEFYRRASSWARLLLVK